MKYHEYIFNDVINHQHTINVNISMKFLHQYLHVTSFHDSRDVKEEFSTISVGGHGENLPFSGKNSHKKQILEEK